MKKVVCVLLLMSLAVILAGCGSPFSAPSVLPLPSPVTPPLPSVSPQSTEGSSAPAAAPAAQASPTPSPEPAPPQATPVPTALPTPDSAEEPEVSAEPSPSEAPEGEAKTPADETDEESAPSTSARATSSMAATIEAEFLRLVNNERSSVGVGKLSVNGYLDGVAQLRSGELLTLYSHTRPSGGEFYTAIDQSQYPYSLVAENIGGVTHVGISWSSSAPAFTGSAEELKAAAKYIFEAFKASPGHYGNMINPDYVHTGVGISCYYDEACNNIPVFYLAHIFGASL